jgi:ABC-2 type transport system ATP-binding protein
MPGPSYAAAVESPEARPAGAAAAAVAGTPRLLSVESGLLMRGVSRRYGGKTILDALDLEVPPRTSVMVAGPNGVGKTTLLRVAAGVITAHGGSVRLAGLDPDADWREYHRRLGFLSPGDRGIYARLTVRQNLDFWAHLALVPRRSRRASVELALERFALQELATRRADRLSMGQRQRVRLALTFLHEPSLVLLDEPATSLDQEGMDLLRRVVREHTVRGGSLLWCAPTGDHHGLVADRAFLLTGGKLERT